MSGSAKWPRHASGRAKMVSELAPEEFREQLASSFAALLNVLPAKERLSLITSPDGVLALRAAAITRMVIMNADFAARASKPAPRSPAQ